MIEILREMILGVTTAAIFSAVMLQLTQKNALSEIVRLATGMLMILVLLAPLSRLSMPSFANWLHVSQQTVASQTARAQERNDKLSTQSIGGAISQYIEKQANELGMPCNVRTSLDMGEDGTIGIKTITLTGALTEVQRTELMNMVAQDCGVLKEQILFAEE